MWKSGSPPTIALASASVKNSIPWSVVKWYFTQNRSPPALTHMNVWLEKPSMFRHVRGIPRSPMSKVTWCADSGESVQKSHCMLLSRRCVSARRFCEWMKSENLLGSRMKNTGVLLPTRS